MRAGTARRPWPEPERRVVVAVLLAGMILLAGAARQGADGQTGGGCSDEQKLHVGCAGGLGGATILGRVVASSADNVAGLGARAAKGAADLAPELAVGGGRLLSRGIDDAAGSAGHVFNSHWEETAGIVGRLAADDGVLKELPELAARHPKLTEMTTEQVARYADETPGFWKDAGVELYLEHPERWAELGGDELLSWATARSPAMREAVQEVASTRFERAIGSLDAVDVTDAVAVAQFESQHGIRLVADGAKLVMQLHGPDYRYDADVTGPEQRAALMGSSGSTQIAEHPTSERASWTEEAAIARAEALDEGYPVREERHDLPGLYAFRIKRDQKPRLPMHWIGAESHLRSGSDDDWGRLMLLVRAHEPPGVEPTAFAKLWVAFHQPAFSSVCGPDDLGLASPAPTSVPTDNSVIYTFHSRTSGEPCAHQILVVAVPDKPADE